MADRLTGNFLQEEPWPDHPRIIAVHGGIVVSRLNRDPP